MVTIKKFVVIGPESTGKSTLCSQLAEYYETIWVPEYAREYLEKNGTDYSYDDLLTIGKGQINLEEGIRYKVSGISDEQSANSIEHRTSNIKHRTSNQSFRPHHRRRVRGQHPARAAQVTRRGHQERFMGHAANFQDHRGKERCAGRGIVSGLQHGHRHGGHRVGGQGGRRAEIHQHVHPPQCCYGGRAEAQSVAHRRGRQRQRRSAGGLTTTN